MGLLNFLGAISFTLTLLSLYLLGVPSVWNFFWFSLAQVLQVYIFYKTKQWFLLLQMFTLIIFNAINWLRWIGQGVGI